MRYIDADKLCEALKSMASVQYPDKQNTILGVVSSIENFPTADVVPKSEADNWYQLYHSIKEELKQEKMYHRETENLCDRYCIESQQAKTQLAREILSDLKKEVHNKATYTHAKDTYSFINLNTFDQIINEMIRRCENHGNQEV